MTLSEQIQAMVSTLEMQIEGFAKESYAKDQRIADLERQLAEYKQAMFDAGRIAAEAFEPAVEQQPVAVVDEGDDGMFAYILPNVTVKVDQKLYAAPQAADTDKVREALKDVIACFDAAEIEGLSIVLAETADERLKDLLERRVMHARYAAEEALTMAVQAPVREVPGWQPIETAPRGAKGISFFLAAWGPEEDQSVGKCIRIGDDFYAAGVFYCLGNKEKPYELREVKVHPTHWMPLPAAPLQQEGDRG